MSERNPFETPGVEEAARPRFGEPGDMILADRGKRFLGNLVDGLVYLGAALPGLGLMMADGEQVGTAVMGLGIAGMHAYQCYGVVTRGQSVAKRALGMRIVRADGQIPGFVHGVLLRSWLFFALGLLGPLGTLIGLVDALMIFGEECQCLHDKVAGTKVVEALPGYERA